MFVIIDRFLWQAVLAKHSNESFFKHVHNYLLSNSLIYKYQSGFLPGHSTVHHLIEVVH